MTSLFSWRGEQIREERREKREEKGASVAEQSKRERRVRKKGQNMDKTASHPHLIVSRQRLCSSHPTPVSGQHLWAVVVSRKRWPQHIANVLMKAA